MDINKYFGKIERRSLADDIRTQIVEKLENADTKKELKEILGNIKDTEEYIEEILERTEE